MQERWPFVCGWSHVAVYAVYICCGHRRVMDVAHNLAHMQAATIHATWLMWGAHLHTCKQSVAMAAVKKLAGPTHGVHCHGRSYKK